MSNCFERVFLRGKTVKEILVEIFNLKALVILKALVSQIQISMFILNETNRKLNCIKVLS